MKDSRQIAIVGAACRLPGAKNEASLVEVLNKGQSTVSGLPEGRWHTELLYHPDQRAPGASYTFAGGYLNDPFDFDIGVFGMSPREAEQVDPQQRLLAELVWEALENARIPPSAIAGKEVGVYIGVSALDHANLFGGDPGSIESHFMTGNTLSIVANRISYLFDLKGPSFVVDTACSSSLVAVDRALADLHSGRVDMAITGGVNMLMSPAPFVGFSRAQMLSPTGTCKPFSDQADGYVRAEGGVVFVLQREDQAAPGAIRASIIGSAVNSDGRTSGIALPGLPGQRALLERAYQGLSIGPGDLSFVEAHGTGTAVGDPIEATAIGMVLGQQRSRPLPIGSIKSNVGHLEPASGVAGMMKSLIAMEQRVLPRTLHLERLNPNIDFPDLNLQPAVQAIPLDGDELYCGISSFGFGGTNAHVVMRGAANRERPAAPKSDVLVISSHCEESLAALCTDYASRLEDGADPQRLAAAVASGRELMRHRAVLPIADRAAMARSLNTFAEGKKASAGERPALVGTALPGAANVCFVYNGNGSQWVGMGREAYAANKGFRAAFDTVSAQFTKLGFENLSRMLHAEDLDETLGTAACSQPLLFAIQHAITQVLADKGLRPSIVLGHSVGEIAAAHASGALTMQDAARLIAARAHSQEAVHCSGGMCVVAASRARVVELIEEVGLTDLCIAADNSESSVTVSGSETSLTALMRHARKVRVAARKLDIEYPYHSALLDHIREDFKAELGVIRPRKPVVPFISTVTGSLVEDASLDGAYWWHNMRDEVLFRKAVRTAAERGANLFIEVGPSSVLASAVRSEVEAAGFTARSIHSLANAAPADVPADPLIEVLARAIAHGFEPTRSEVGPVAVDRSIDLPGYPWQRRTFAYKPSSETVDMHGLSPRHPLIGARLAQGVPEWRTIVDARLVPYLADHVVGGEVIMPATGLAEMALAVAREIWPAGGICLEDFDIVHALIIPSDGQCEVSVRYSQMASTVEIYSRPRFGADAWTLCAVGRVSRASDVRGDAPQIGEATSEHRDAGAIYRKAVRSGIEYGPAFSLFKSLRRQGEYLIEARQGLPPTSTGAFSREHVLHPASLDAAFHGLFDYVEDNGPPPKTWLPIRFERLSVWQDNPDVAAVTIRIDKSSDTLKTVSLWLLDGNNKLVARLDGALLKALPHAQGATAKSTYHVEHQAAGQFDGQNQLFEQVTRHFSKEGLPGPSDGWLLLHAHMRAAIAEALDELSDSAGTLDFDSLLSQTSLNPATRDHMTLMLDEAVRAGVLVQDKGGFKLVRDQGEPDAETILAGCVAEFPTAATDIALSAQAAAGLTDLLQGRPIARPRAPLLQQYEVSSLRLEPVIEAATSCIDKLCSGRATPLHVVVSEAHGSGLLIALADRASSGAIRLSVATDDSVAAERLARRLPPSARIDIILLSGQNAASADLVLLRQPARESEAAVSLTSLCSLLRPGGTLIAFRPAEDTLVHFHRGETEGDRQAVTQSLAALLAGDARMGEVASFSDAAAGFEVHVSPRLLASGHAIGVLGRGLETDALCNALSARGVQAARLSPDNLPPASDDLIWFADRDEAGASAQTLQSAVIELRSVLLTSRTLERRPRFWIVASGREQAGALLSFARVAMNEMADLDIRFVELSEGVPPAQTAAGLASILQASGEEREWRLTALGVEVTRLRRGLPLSRAKENAAPAVSLDFPRVGQLEDFHWVETDREAPGPGQIEIELIATGLNFRDVMLAMGMLGDDVLEEGLAGSVYGLECVGRVCRKGKGSKRFKVGDIVVGFGQSSFASHILAPEQGFMRLPETLSPEAAAGIPVAFLTAWYSLVELARLAPGEKVLIHGGAGGVGLAAIQIARAIGAEIIATVSTPDKEALARFYGADHIYDSRSLEFVDEIRENHGGVSVVLNSLSGDAMRGSIKCLLPRGRFIELGKRDYVANSLIGLRPFRRNLSYFGVDVDQLLALDPGLTKRGLSAIAKGIAEGLYLPLPTFVFRSNQVSEAFRLMQSAGHVGKIVITAPRPDEVPSQASEGFVPGPGVQLVVGGTRGFGLATAIWLADKGARKIVVASRSGELDSDWSDKVEALRTAGVTFQVLQLDATDGPAVEKLVANVVAEHGPISGVWHTAVNLQDGMIDTLDETALSQVLAPKVIGSENLHRATLDQPIEHFVLYSSASALIGNPGQGAYAAANGFMEGLARRRQAEGLPALAVAWGAIADVGLLADRSDTLESLGRIAGVSGMRSGEALAHLEHVLALAGRLADPVVTISDFVDSGALFTLPVPSSPTFAAHFAARAAGGETGRQSLAEMIAGKSDVEAHAIVLGILAGEVAQIMRFAVEDVDLDESIDNLGMDSLMALELRMTIENKYHLELPMMAISAVGNLRELANRILGLVRTSAEGEAAAPLSDVESALIAIHGGSAASPGAAQDDGSVGEAARAT